MKKQEIKFFTTLTKQKSRLIQKSLRNFLKKSGNSGQSMVHYNIDYFAFWDKRDNKNTLVIATHGFVKKTQKTPKEEIEKAMRIKEYYFSKTK